MSRACILHFLRVGLVQAGNLAMQAIKAPREHGLLLGDIPALVIVAVGFATLAPRGQAAELARTAA